MGLRKVLRRANVTKKSNAAAASSLSEGRSWILVLEFWDYVVTLLRVKNVFCRIMLFRLCLTSTTMTKTRATTESS